MKDNRTYRASTLRVFTTIVIAVLLILLHLSVTFVDGIHDFFSGIAAVHITGFLIYVVCIWLAFSLWVVYRQWRVAHNEQEHLEAVISSISPDVLLLVAPDRTVTRSNASVERIFGYRQEEIIGCQTDMLYGDRRINKGRRHEIYDALESRGFHFGLATGKRKDGSTLPLEIISGDIKGRSGAVLLIRDITERNEVEVRQRRVEARALSSQKLESLGLLAGGIAHDFNNLLMIVQGHSDLITMQGSKDAALAESIAEIRKSTDRGRDFCRHLLSFAGRAPRDIQPVNLSEVMRYTDRMLLVRLPRNVTVVDKLSDNMPTINGDDAQLHQVAMNLMINALEAIGDEEGTITISSGVRDCAEDDLEKSTVSGESLSGPIAFFSVADTGCGMDEDTQQKLWEPFYTTKQEGTGMGLAAVLGIVHSHSGVIKVESEPDSGCTMTVFFPLKQ